MVSAQSGIESSEQILTVFSLLQEKYSQDGLFTACALSLYMELCQHEEMLRKIQ
jgi:hypothetical protein